MPSPLLDEIAIVTGASSGIGRAAARELVAAGARVALVARRKELLDAVAAELNGSAAGPGRALAIAADVTDERQVERMVARTIGEFLGVDLLVSAAGAAHVAPLAKLKAADLDRLWAVNVKGALLCAQQVAPILCAQRRGTIVHFGSVSSKRGWASASINQSGGSGDGVRFLPAVSSQWWSQEIPHLPT